MGDDENSWAPGERADHPDGTAPADPIGGRAVAATVKWFRADKGYGFVELSGGQGDAFLHLNALRLAGRESAPIGAKLRVVVSAGPKGVQVSRVIEVDASSAVESPVRSVSAGARAQRRPAPDA